MKNDTAVVNPEVNQKPKTKQEWALELASRGVGIHPLVHTRLADGSCSCGSQPDKDGRLISPSGKPCKPGKHPSSRNGVDDAVSDPATIRGRFKHDPAMNYGATMGSKGFILDLDVTGGKDGINNMLKYLNASRPPNKQITEYTLRRMTFTVETTTGGLHLYFLHDAPCGNATNVLPGVDIRGLGGYVVGPGSVIHKLDDNFEFVPKEYRVITDKPFMKAPAGILALVNRAKDRAENADESRYPDLLDSDSAKADAQDYLKIRKPAVAFQGGNQHTLVTAMGVKDRNISKEVCFELLTEEGGFNDRCEPPWGLDELKMIIENAYKYGKEAIGSKQSLLDMLDGEDSEVPGGHKSFADYFKSLANDPDPKPAANDNAIDSDEEELRFIPMSHADMRAERIPEYLFDRLFEVGTIAVVYGLSQSYKTFTVASMLLAAAAGHHEWCGIKTATKRLGRKLRIIYVIGEGGSSFIKSRMTAWLKKNKLTLEDVEFYPIARNMPNLLAGKDFDNLLKSIKSPRSPCREPDVIVFDTLSRAIAGQDEDKSQNLSLLLDNVQKKLQATFPKILTLFIAHTGKDPSKGIRGSYAMYAGLDAVVYAEQGKGKALSSVWEIEKTKDGADGWSMTIGSTFEEIDMPDIDGNPGTKLVPVFDVLTATGTSGGEALEHYQRTGALTDTDIVRIVLDKERKGATLILTEVTDRADALVTLPGALDKRRDNFEKRLRRRLGDDSKAAEKVREALKGLFTWKHKGSNTVYTFTGQGGSLGDWAAFNRANGAGLIEIAEAQPEEDDDGE